MKKKRSMGNATAVAIRGALSQGLGTPLGVETPLQAQNRMSHMSGALGQQARILRSKRARGY